MMIKCVVATHNAAGEPDFYPVKVDVTQREHEDGEHYELAIAMAGNVGYEGSMVVFDENDGPDWLFANFNWNKVPELDSPSP